MSLSHGGLDRATVWDACGGGVGCSCGERSCHHGFWGLVAGKVTGVLLASKVSSDLVGSVRLPQVPIWHVASSVFSILSWFYKEPGGLRTGSSMDST